MNPDGSLMIHEDLGAGTFRVHRRALTSDDVYQQELRQVFDKVWLYIGHESEIREPNDFVSRTVADRPLILCRDEQGQVQVLLNTCLHRGAEVCRDAKGNARVFRCFYHAWTYDTSGKLVGVPNRKAYGESFDTSQLGLRRPARVDTYRGFIFASFNPDVEDLPEYLGAARPYLDLVGDQAKAAGMEIVSGTHEYTIDANWKLLVENSLDGYHLGPLHVTYFDFLKSQGDGQVGRRKTQAHDLGNGHAVIIDEAPWGRPVARWVPSFGEEVRPEIEARRQRLEAEFGPERAAQIANDDVNLFVFPNLVINDIMAVVVRTIWPVSAGRMAITAWALAPVDDGPELRALTTTSFVSFLGPGGFATPDDMEALESCQRGFATWREVEWSDVSRGMHLTEGHESSDEPQMRAFWRRWNELVTGQAAEGQAAVAQIAGGQDR
jgi:p-cumate 2,3-dioxygenase alpha subunit